MVTRLARTGLIVATATFLAISSLPLAAGDYGHPPHPRLHHERGQHRQNHGDAVIGGAGLPSVVPGIGTFAGSISAVRVRGSGIYFAVEGSKSDVVGYRPPPAKIIEIGAEMEDAACAYEAGVCVIRPRN